MERNTYEGQRSSRRGCDTRRLQVLFSATPSHLRRRSPLIWRSACRRSAAFSSRRRAEIAAINMVYGCASSGVRCMTSSSSPGISLKSEGVSYMAGSDLPCVIVNVHARWPRTRRHSAIPERLLAGYQGAGSRRLPDDSYSRLPPFRRWQISWAEPSTKPI